MLQAGATGMEEDKEETESKNNWVKSGLGLTFSSKAPSDALHKRSGFHGPICLLFFFSV
jgi:hypothetical protein